MSKYEELIAAARAEIGYTEKPANSNKTKFGKWYGYDGVPWCMMFVQFLHDAIGCTLPYKTASCFGLLNWYKANKPQCIKKEPKPGYIVIYTFGHTGIVVSGNSEAVTAIEGNTSLGSSGSQDNGGCVCHKVRSANLVEAYIDGIDIKEKPKPAPKKKEDDYMNKAEILKELGDQYIETFDQLPKWAKADMRELLDTGVINGGTNASVDPDDINMFLSDIKSIVATKRLIDKIR